MKDLLTIFCWTECLCWAFKSCSFCGICQLEGFLHGALSTACHRGLNSQKMPLFSAGTARQRKASETFLIHFAGLNQTHPCASTLRGKSLFYLTFNCKPLNLNYYLHHLLWCKTTIQQPLLKVSCKVMLVY